MKIGILENIKPFLQSQYIIDGLYMPINFDDVKKYKHIVHIFDDGFSLFVNFKKNAWLVSCGFKEDAKNVFKKCKQSLQYFLEDNKDSMLLSIVHAQNKKARIINNALNLCYVKNIESGIYKNLRLYKYMRA